MVDEVLRLRATIVADDVLATLQRMESRLGAFERNAGRGARQAAPHWAVLRTQVIGVNTALMQTTPLAGAAATALVRIAATAGPMGWVSLAIAGVGTAAVLATSKLAQFAKGVVEIKHLGEEAKMTTREVRALNAAAEAAGVAPQVAISSVTNLRKSLDGLRLSGSSTRQALLQMTGGRSFLRDLMALEGNPAAQRREVFKIGEELLKQGKRFEAEKVYAAFDMDPAMLRMTQKQFDDFHDSIRDHTDAEKKAADELWAKWNKVGVVLGNIKDKILLPMLPIASQFVDQMLIGLGHVEGVVDAIMPAIATGAAFIVSLTGNIGSLVEKMQALGSVVKGIWDWLNGFPDLIKQAEEKTDEWRKKFWAPGFTPEEMFKGPPGGIRPPKGFRSGELTGGEGTPNMLGAAGDDRLDAELGTVARSDIVADGEGTVEEGTYRALHRFYHDARTLGGGGVGGPGGGGAGGAGGGAGGGTGLGGGPGGSQSSGDGDSTSKSDGETAAAAEGLTSGPKGNQMPSDMVGLERQPPGTGGDNAWAKAGGTDTGTLAMPEGAKLPEGAPAGATPAAGGGPGIDRSSLHKELEDPEVRKRIQHLTNSEIGKDATAQQKKIFVESLMNRALARKQTLKHVSKGVKDDPRRGYYDDRNPNFASKAPKSQAEIDQFKKDILDPVAAGSDESTKALGFPATGNASANVAKNQLAKGTPGKLLPGGKETMFMEETPKRLATLNALRRKEQPAGTTVATPATGTSKSDASVPPGAGANQTKVASLDKAAGVSQSSPAGAKIPKEQALAIATSQMGLKEVANREKLKEFFRSNNMNIDPSVTPWCAAFANTALRKAGLPESAKGEERYAAKTFMNYGSPVDKKDGPNAGDLAVFQHGGISHVGFLTGKKHKDGRWEVRGGNQGDQVKDSYYRPDQITRVRRPPAATGPGDPNAPGAAPQAPLVKPKIGDQSPFKSSEAATIDRANANQTAMAPPSSVNVDVRHNGTKATAKAKTEGPQFAETKVRNQTQGQPTEEFSQAGVA